MKNKLSLFLFVFLITWIGISPENAKATGTACCPAGYTLNTTQRNCVNNQTTTVCQGLGNGICDAVPFVFWCNRSAITNSCQGVAQTWSGLSQAAITQQCISFAVSILGTILGNIAGNIACPGIAGQIASLTGAASVPTQCVAPLACDFNMSNPTCQNPTWSIWYPPVRGNCPDVAPSASNVGQRYINTAVGCLNVTGNSTINQVLSWSVGIAGGIALSIILAGAFQITSAQGDAKRVKAGQELITAALAGLFLIAISVVLLNFLGVNVLGLQSLGFQF